VLILEYTLIPQINVSEGEQAVLDLVVSMQTESGLGFQNIYPVPVKFQQYIIH
jgi:hypothetical protein